VISWIMQLLSRVGWTGSVQASLRERQRSQGDRVITSIAPRSTVKKHLGTLLVLAVMCNGMVRSPQMCAWQNQHTVSSPT